MTARFGRNKRRAARAAVEHAEARAVFAEQFWGKLHREERYERQRAQDILAEVVERIIRAVGPQSALIPAKLQPLVRLDTFNLGTPIRWRVRNSAPDIDGFPSLDYRNGYSSIGSQYYVDLLKLVAVVEADPPSFATLIRFVVEPLSGLPGFHRRQFMISREALERIGWRQDDVRYFVEDVVHKLLTLQERHHG